MTPNQSPAHPNDSTVTNSSWNAILTTAMLVTVGPLVVTVLLTYPMIGLGAIAGLFARPLLRVGLKASRYLGRLLTGHFDLRLVPLTRTDLDTSRD